MPTDELQQKLEVLGFQTWSDQNHDLLATYPANANSTFDGVSISKGERDDYGNSDPYEYIEVVLLHPNPFHNSQYWDKLNEVLAIFKGKKRIARWDWREGARKKALQEQARKEKLLAKGSFHVIQFNWNDRREKTVLTTNDAVSAYNAYVALPEVWDLGEWLEEGCWSKRCECKILHLSGEDDKVYEQYFWRDSILRSYNDQPSLFEQNFFIDPHTRCGQSYYEGHYSYSRRRYYNLMTGKSWVVCPGGIASASHISDEEKKQFTAMDWSEYPVQPRMRDGSVVRVERPKPSKYVYTEPYSKASYPVHPPKVEDELNEKTINDAKGLIPKLFEDLMGKHGCSVKAVDEFRCYITLCALVEKQTGEDLYKPIPVPK